MAQFHPELFEILLDQQTFQAFGGGEVAWCGDASYRCDGADNSIFPKGQLPMKKVLLDDAGVVPNYPLASLGYAMAHRADRVEGPPVALLRVKLSKEGQLRAFLDGTLLSNPRQGAVAFLKPIKHDYYPELQDLVMRQISLGVGEYLLAHGYNILENEMLFQGINS